MKRGMKNVFYKYKCYPEETGLNIGEGEDVFKLRTTLAEKTLCVRAMNTCRLKAVLTWDPVRSDEGTALLTGFKDEDGYI